MRDFDTRICQSTHFVHYEVVNRDKCELSIQKWMGKCTAQEMGNIVGYVHHIIDLIGMGFGLGYTWIGENPVSSEEDSDLEEAMGPSNEQDDDIPTVVSSLEDRVKQIFLNDDVLMLKKMFDDGLLDNNFVFNNKDTLLHMAARQGSLKIVDELLSYGFSTETPNLFNDNATALFYAIKYDKLLVAEILMDRGASTSNLNRFKDSAIYVSVYFGRRDLLAYFIEKGLDCNTESSDGDSPLWRAAYEAQEEMVAMLVDSGADVNVTLKSSRRDQLTWSNIHKGGGILHLAAMNPKLCGIADYVIEHGINLNLMDSYGRTPLYRAVTRKNLPMVEKLIEAKADVNMSCPLVPGINAKNCRIVRLLVEAGAIVNTCTNPADNNTEAVYSPLTSACARGAKEIVSYLLEQSADPNFIPTGVCHNSPMHFAVKYPFYGNDASKMMVLDLIQHGANVDVVNMYNETPLYTAAYRDNIDSVWHLIQAGCDLHIASSLQGIHNTPLCIAIDFEHKQVAEIITGAIAYFSKEAWLWDLDRDDPNGLLGTDHRFTNWFWQQALNPRNLQLLCRNIIRKKITSRNAAQKVYSLPLPLSMLDFLNYSDLQKYLTSHSRSSSRFQLFSP